MRCPATRFSSASNVIDEIKRRRLGHQRGGQFRAARVTTFLTQTINLNAQPRAIRSENGLEPMSQAFTDWYRKQGVEPRLVQKKEGTPNQNTYRGRSNRIYQEELRSAYLSEWLVEVRNSSLEPFTGQGNTRVTLHMTWRFES